MRKTVVSLLLFLILSPAYSVGFDTDAPKTIKADKIEYNVKSETVKTTGNTDITNAYGQRMTLTDSYLSQKGQDLSGNDIKMWLGQHIYVESDNITRKDGDTIATDALFTACSECDSWGDAWQISASRIVHDMDSRMLYFYNPVLWAASYVPVFWLPYYSMPDPGVKHKTGFLMPNMESTNQMGTRINIPFYIYISENQDMTINTAYMTQENPLFKLEHRLNADHSEFRTRGAYTNNKAGENRWYISNNDIIELGEYARSSIYLERASDKTFLQKYGFYDDRPYLDSGAKIELFGQSSYVVADTHIFQELRSTRYSVPSGNILPNIRGVYQTSPLYKETYATFSTDVLGISGDGTSSQRAVGDVRLTSPWTLWGGNRFTASIDARYDIYNFNNTTMQDSSEYSGIKSRFLPSGYLEWSLPMMRQTSTWTQILEPRARLTLMRRTDYEQFAQNSDSAGTFLSDSTLFSTNRYSGFDLWENGSYADYGVRWAAFAPDNRAIEVFFGQSYDFASKDVIDPNSGFHDGLSDYVGRISFNNGSWLDLSTRFRTAQQDFSLNHIETTATIGTSRNFLNIGHIWSQQFSDTYTIDDTINEITAGIGIQLTERWSVRFNSVYNATYDIFHRHSGGIFYNHPCYYMSLEYRRDNTSKYDYVGTTTYQFRFGMSIDGKQY